MSESFSQTNSNREITKLHLNIQGEEIVVRSPSNNVNFLKKAAETINERLNALHQNQPQIPHKKLSLMIALQFCFDNLTKNVQIDQIEKELLMLKESMQELSELWEEAPKQNASEETNIAMKI